jgi:hypothetical protein
MMEKQSSERPLDEVMLAMDVVDTLRHRDMLVERELHAEDRDQKLIERLRQIYASQGLDVPEHVLAEGVAALKEERFVYKPHRRGLAVFLARLYINRGKWGKRAGIVAFLAALLWGGYQFLLAGPAERRLDKKVTELNVEIRETTDKLDTLQRNIDRFTEALSSTPSGLSPLVSDTAKARQSLGKEALRRARGLIGEARELARKPTIRPETYETGAAAVRGKLDRKQDLLSRAAEEVAKAEAAVATITALRQLPQDLSAQRDAALAAAKVDGAKRQARQQYDRGISALRAGDLSGATAAAHALKDLRAQLEQQYEIRIVSRPDEYSGVWRVPEKNPKARNYYIIVEAVAAGGTTLSLPITSEEDGKIYNVSKWGLRVNSNVFQRVSADKKDDGIIQDRRFGIKRRGHVEPEYFVQTTGGAITDW